MLLYRKAIGIASAIPKFLLLYEVPVKTKKLFKIKGPLYYASMNFYHYVFE